MAKISLNQKMVVYVLFLMLIVSSVYLFQKEQAEENLDYQKNWWVVSFADAQDSSLDFTLENHSPNSEFRWEIASGEAVLGSGKIVLPPGGQKTILFNKKTDEPVKSSALKSPSLPQNKKITVKVITGEETKEIYKILN